MYTTNEYDQREAAKLQARLREEEKGLSKRHSQNPPDEADVRLPNVSIDEGAHKYVLISALLPFPDDSKREFFVVSKRDAAYHRNAAEPFIEKLEQSGYSSIRVTGGGRIALDNQTKTISIYGYSYGFGLADHALSKSVVEKDQRYAGYAITWSNEGY